MSLTINYGDTIMFMNEDPTDAHTVTFNSSGHLEPTEYMINKTLYFNPIYVYTVPKNGSYYGGLVSVVLYPFSSVNITFYYTGMLQLICLYHNYLPSDIGKLFFI